MQVKPNNSRDIRFDILKVIGIVGIFAAHAIYGNSQNSIEMVVQELRNFDVPLMVIISGSVFYHSSGDKQYSFITYLRKRIPRLIIPVWFFLLVFFIFTYLVTLAQDENQVFPFTLKEIIGSFCLLNYISIGYVWIIRVFVLVAIVSPLLLKLKQALSSRLLFLMSLAIIYGAYEVLASFILKLNVEDTDIANPIVDFIYGRLFLFIFWQQICFYLIPYGCLFGLGMIMARMKNSSILLISIFAGIVYLILGLNYYSDAGSFVSTYIAKFPPRLYYVSYGIFMSTLIYLFVDFCLNLWNKLNYHNNQIEQSKKIILFISSSSLWIYLWHILLIYHGKAIFRILNIKSQAIERFLVWLILSVLITYFQKIFISYIIKRTTYGQKYSEALSVMFLK